MGAAEQAPSPPPNLAHAAQADATDRSDSFAFATHAPAPQVPAACLLLSHPRFHWILSQRIGRRPEIVGQAPERRKGSAQLCMKVGCSTQACFAVGNPAGVEPGMGCCIDVRRATVRTVLCPVCRDGYMLCCRCPCLEGPRWLAPHHLSPLQVMDFVLLSRASKRKASSSLSSMVEFT